MPTTAMKVRCSVPNLKYLIFLNELPVQAFFGMFVSLIKLLLLILLYYYLCLFHDQKVFHPNR
jgi:hypothetical protein